MGEIKDRSGSKNFAEFSQKYHGNTGESTVTIDAFKTVHGMFLKIQFFNDNINASCQIPVSANTVDLLKDFIGKCEKEVVDCNNKHEIEYTNLDFPQENLNFYTEG